MYLKMGISLQDLQILYNYRVTHNYYSEFYDSLTIPSKCKLRFFFAKLYELIKILNFSQMTYFKLGIIRVFGRLCSLILSGQLFTQFCRGREPTDDMSLRNADTSLPDLLGRRSLRFAEMSMRNTSKCACVIQEVFFKLVF